MIVWGGFRPFVSLNTGGRYDPSTNTWTPTSLTNVPTARDSHTAVWIGTEMIIWGAAADASGGRYNPSSDSWIATSITDAPDSRIHHAAVWTGSEMIVWGGTTVSPSLTAEADTAPLSIVGRPPALSMHRAPDTIPPRFGPGAK